MFIKIFRVFALAIVISCFTGISFLYGYQAGLRQNQQNEFYFEFPKITLTPAPTATPKPIEKPHVVPKPQTISWGGPELWEAVNNRRVKNGVNSLGKKDELCTIAAIRLLDLKELGKLDAHLGFSNMPEERPDLKWIFEKYNVAEFLIVGYETPEATVDAWEHTLGHKSLVAGGEWVWGCIYAQDTFGVAITAY